MARANIHITGIVQGVGFRPFVYNLALRHRLTGWVKNTSAGVDITVEGSLETIQDFAVRLKNEKPPLAHIDYFDLQYAPPENYPDFQIIHSQAISETFQPISPDICVCDDCLREMMDPHDRRYRYPFINCTNCGPRFTIIKDIPYDRPETTMVHFPMCPDCQAEYTDPTNRRFHAQPIACPTCGPQVWLETPAPLDADLTRDQDSPRLAGDFAVLTAQKLLAEGKILAVKGLGGFHLACDATNEATVAELRRRKLRVDKPFAVMVGSSGEADRHCLLTPAARQALTSRERPVVIAARAPGSHITPAVSPNQDTLGIMLPYTPLHYLLFASPPNSSPGEAVPLQALVMTSGNLSEEPIASSNQAARERLPRLADIFLMHNRSIHIRCDDSVVRSYTGFSAGLAAHPTDYGSILPVRRSRGYAPFPVYLPLSGPPVLAGGAELKNTFTLTHDQYAFVSHHIGDMENYETLESFQSGIQHFERLFRARPQVLAYDLHPNYLATQYILKRAEAEDLPVYGIQHHHAHIAACMAENGLTGEHPVIGFAFDGTGYGTDGNIWGGEVLLADYRGFQRRFHLEYFPLPGGDAAIRRPARIALASLWHAGLTWDPSLPPVAALSAQEQQALQNQLEHGVNTRLTSSMGRLFDAVSALAGIRQSINYEAQAAIELEALVDPAVQDHYPFEISAGDPSATIVVKQLFEAVLSDIRSAVSSATISARFHNTIAAVVDIVANRLRQETGLGSIVLSGGVWQNITLLAKTLRLLQRSGFSVYTHRQVPTNDGGVSLGQAVIAAAALSAKNGIMVELKKE